MRKITNVIYIHKNIYYILSKGEYKWHMSFSFSQVKEVIGKNHALNANSRNKFNFLTFYDHIPYSIPGDLRLD